eukprot:GHVT01047770.1.p1 GENE.GHVT01047770.1~~GHVT01047770.1.p1  ORF type:complete len:788 (-),score=75.20 GHVT01047770.1:1032-3293(-)
MVACASLNRRPFWTLIPMMLLLLLLLAIGGGILRPAYAFTVPALRSAQILSGGSGASYGSAQLFDGAIRPTHQASQWRRHHVTALKMVANVAVKTHEILMPALSSTMKEGKITQWCKNVGDRVEVGKTIMVVESDKADMDIESFSEGYLAIQLVPEGGEAAVGDVVGLLVDRAEDIPLVELPNKSGSDPPAVNGLIAAQGSVSTSVRDDIPLDLGTGIFMPTLSSTCKIGRIAKWKKKEGDRINQGDVVVVVENDKADVDVESPTGGYLAKILAWEGNDVDAGTCIARISPTQDTLHQIKESAVASAGACADHSTSRAPGVESTDIFMPALSSTMAEGRITQWIKKVGDRVKVGESVMVVESDKADMEVESFEEGFLGKILVNEGEMAAVGDTVALIVQSAEDVEKLQNSASAFPIVNSTVAPETSKVSAEVTLGNEESKHLARDNLDPTTTVIKDATEEMRLADIDPELLVDELIRRAESSDSGKKVFEELRKTSSGQATLKRMAQRVRQRHPAANVVLSAFSSRPGSLQHISTRAAALAREQPIDIGQISGSGMGGRVYAEDLDRAPSSSSAVSRRHDQTASTPLAVTPSARTLASARNVDLSSISGTGPLGRITADDVRNHLNLPGEARTVIAVQQHGDPQTKNVMGKGPSGSTATSGHQVTLSPVPRGGLVPLSGMQKAIVKNMEQTLNVPIFRASYTVCTDKLDKLHLSLKPKGVTMSALFAKAVAITLEKHPLLNAHYTSKEGGSVE